MSAPALTTYANGLSQVSGDNLNTFVSWAVTYAQIKAFTPNPVVPNLLVYMQGYSAAGDGGQGNFYWSATTGTDDGGLTTIVPSGSTSGCWIRIPNYSPVYTPQAVNISGNTTYTANNVINQVLLREGTSGTATDTFPSAAAIIGALPGKQVGSIQDILIVNFNSGLLTLAAGSGVTFNFGAGVPTIAASSSKLLKIYIASTSSIVVYG